MKKLFVMVLFAISTTALTSCIGGVEGKAKSYAKELAEASMNHDTEKQNQIEKELNKWLETLSSEDYEKAQDVIDQVTRKAYFESIENFCEDKGIDIDSCSGR